MSSEFKGLDGRSREVLASVIVAYIESAVPVSSRQLTRGGKFGLSSASLRNAMADLEDLGFLTHPHVSAGRIPTDLGYRAFVRELMTTRLPSAEERARIAEELAPEPFETDRFFQATSRVLSRLTGEVGVVAAPASARFVLDSVHFTRLTDRRILVAEVSDAGLVESRLIETRDDFAQVELDAISRRLTVDYAGKTLDEIRGLLLDALAEEKVRMDRALARTLELGRRAFAEEPPRGRRRLRGRDRVSAREAGIPRRRRGAAPDVPRVRGKGAAREPPHGLPVLRTARASSSARTAPSRARPRRPSSRCRTARETGSSARSASSGPRRMEYDRVVPLVEELGRYVSHRLTEGAA